MDIEGAECPVLEYMADMGTLNNIISSSLNFIRTSSREICSRNIKSVKTVYGAFLPIEGFRLLSGASHGFYR